MLFYCSLLHLHTPTALTHLRNFIPAFLINHLHFYTRLFYLPSFIGVCHLYVDLKSLKLFSMCPFLRPGCSSDLFFIGKGGLPFSSASGLFSIYIFTGKWAVYLAFSVASLSALTTTMAMTSLMTVIPWWWRCLQCSWWLWSPCCSCFLDDRDASLMTTMFLIMVMSVMSKRALTKTVLSSTNKPTVQSRIILLFSPRPDQDPKTITQQVIRKRVLDPHESRFTSLPLCILFCVSVSFPLLILHAFPAVFILSLAPASCVLMSCQAWIMRSCLYSSGSPWPRTLRSCRSIKGFPWLFYTRQKCLIFLQAEDEGSDTNFHNEQRTNSVSKNRKCPTEPYHFQVDIIWWDGPFKDAVWRPENRECWADKSANWRSGKSVNYYSVVSRSLLCISGIKGYSHETLHWWPRESEQHDGACIDRFFWTKHCFPYAPTVYTMTGPSAEKIIIRVVKILSKQKLFSTWLHIGHSGDVFGPFNWIQLGKAFSVFGSGGGGTGWVNG